MSIDSAKWHRRRPPGPPGAAFRRWDSGRAGGEPVNYRGRAKGGRVPRDTSKAVSLHAPRKGHARIAVSLVDRLEN